MLEKQLLDKKDVMEVYIHNYSLLATKIGVPKNDDEKDELKQIINIMQGIIIAYLCVDCMNSIVKKAISIQDACYQSLRSS